MDICVPRCDICQLLGEEGSLKALCTCKICGVLVHRECYGLRDDEEVNFVCHACKEADEEGLPFDRMDSRAVDLFRAGILETRPVECALCSVKRGLHAMHPLYDNHGSSGQQIVLENPTRPAWVHTLCASVLSTNFGYVYGCCPDGQHQNSDDSRRDDKAPMEDIDDRPPNPKLSTSDSSDNSLHHFAYCLDRGAGGGITEYTEPMKEHKALKCMFCKSDDTESYRLPIQCFAGNVPRDVNSDFSATRDWKLTSGYCCDPFHIGCAAWMTVNGNRRTPRRIFFFPGTDRGNEESEPIAEVYCSFHAQKIENCRCNNLGARHGLHRNLTDSPPCSDYVARKRSREVCDTMDLDKKLPARPEKNVDMNAFGRRAEDESRLNYRAKYENWRNDFWKDEEEASEATHRLQPERVDNNMDIEMDDMMVPEVGARSKVDEPRLQSAEKLSHKISKDARLPAQEVPPSRVMATELGSPSKADEPCVKRVGTLPPRKASAEASVQERVRVASPSPESTIRQEDRPIKRLVTPPSPKRQIATSPMNNPKLYAPDQRKKAAASSGSHQVPVSREPKQNVDDYMHSLPAATATKHRGNNFGHLSSQRPYSRSHSHGHGPVLPSSNNQRAPARMARGRSLVPTHMEKQNIDFHGANMLPIFPRQRPSNNNRLARATSLPISNKENASYGRTSHSWNPATGTGRHSSMTNGRAPDAAVQNSLTSSARPQPKAQYRRKKTAMQVLNKGAAVPPTRMVMERYEEIVAALKPDLHKAGPEQAKTVMNNHKKRWIRCLVQTRQCNTKTFDGLWHLVCEEMADNDLL